MNKLQMAHEFMMKKMETETIDNHWELFYSSWRYADAMQAEADKRKSKPELPSLQQTFIDGVEQPRYAPSCDEWQPDWSQAPNSAMYWAMDGCGQCNWYEREPEVCGSQWDFGSVIEQSDTGYGYQGNWQDSLRKRPQ